MKIISNREYTARFLPSAGRIESWVRQRRWECLKKAKMNKTDEYRERGRNDPRTTDELMEEAAAAFNYKNSDDDVLSGTYWKPVRILHCRADNSVMTAATKLLSSEISDDRIIATDILSQVAFGNETRRSEAADLLLPRFQRETNSEVLNSMSFAFGHIGDARSIPRLVELSSHTDESLRYAVVHGLSGHDDGRAIAALIVLSSDPDDDVRDWATFGLGSQTEADTPELRNALVRRLNDLDDDTRHEALVGLARRGDIRIVPTFLKELKSSSPEVFGEWHLIRNAAKAVVDVAKRNPNNNWCLLLEKLNALELYDPREIQEAIQSCKHVHS